MSYKELVVRALQNHSIKTIDSPLDNEFILDDEWHVEMDRDGAFAATISHISRPRYSEKNHLLIVFSKNENSKQAMEEIKGKIESAIIDLRNRVA